MRCTTRPSRRRRTPLRRPSRRPETSPDVSTALLPAKTNTVELTVKSWQAVGYFALSPYGRGIAPVNSTLRTRRLVVPSPLTPTLSRKGRGSPNFLRPRVLLLIQRYWG